MGRQVPLAAVVSAVFAAWAGCDAKDDDSALDGTDSETVVDDTGATTTPADPLTTDDDLDGWTENDGDCNDHNDAVYPGARERSYDSNCDGDDFPASGEDRYAEALPLLDTDGDGGISLEEFEAGCAESAMIFGSANPGMVETHLTCGGTSSCRGMILHTWNELLEHDCRGVNGCAGWSCVETATGAGWDGPTTFESGQCNWCHGGGTPSGRDVIDT
jgi:hypothetical protein